MPRPQEAIKFEAPEVKAPRNEAGPKLRSVEAPAVAKENEKIHLEASALVARLKKILVQLDAVSPSKKKELVAQINLDLTGLNRRLDIISTAEEPVGIKLEQQKRRAKNYEKTAAAIIGNGAEARVGTPLPDNVRKLADFKKPHEDDDGVRGAAFDAIPLDRDTSDAGFDLNVGEEDEPEASEKRQGKYSRAQQKRMERDLLDAELSAKYSGRMGALRKKTKEFKIDEVRRENAERAVRMAEEEAPVVVDKKAPAVELEIPLDESALKEAAATERKRKTNLRMEELRDYHADRQAEMKKGREISARKTPVADLEFDEMSAIEEAQKNFPAKGYSSQPDFQEYEEEKPGRAMVLRKKNMPAKVEPEIVEGEVIEEPARGLVLRKERAEGIAARKKKEQREIKPPLEVVEPEVIDVENEKAASARMEDIEQLETKAKQAARELPAGQPHAQTQERGMVLFEPNPASPELMALRDFYAEKQADLTKRFEGVRGWINRVDRKAYNTAKLARDRAYELYEKMRAEHVKGNIDKMHKEQTDMADQLSRSFKERQGWGGKLYEKFQKLGPWKTGISLGLMGAGAIAAAPFAFGASVPIGLAVGLMALGKGFGFVSSSAGSYDMMNRFIKPPIPALKFDRQEKAELKKIKSELGWWNVLRNKDGAAKAYEKKSVEILAWRAKTLSESDLNDSIAYLESANAMNGKLSSQDPQYKALMEERARRYKVTLELPKETQEKAAMRPDMQVLFDKYKKLEIADVAFYMELYLKESYLKDKGREEHQQEAEHMIPEEAIQYLWDYIRKHTKGFMELLSAESRKQLLDLEAKKLGDSTVWDINLEFNPELSKELLKRVFESKSVNDYARKAAEKEMREVVAAVEKAKKEVESRKQRVLLDLTAKMKVADAANDAARSKVGKRRDSMAAAAILFGGFMATGILQGCVMEGLQGHPEATGGQYYTPNTTEHGPNFTPYTPDHPVTVKPSLHGSVSETMNSAQETTVDTSPLDVTTDQETVKAVGRAARSGFPVGEGAAGGHGPVEFINKTIDQMDAPQTAATGVKETVKTAAKSAIDFEATEDVLGTAQPASEVGKAATKATAGMSEATAVEAGGTAQVVEEVGKNGGEKDLFDEIGRGRRGVHRNIT